MQSKSIWSQTAKAEKRPRLEEDITCTACVIGGGMAGVLSAYFLTEQGVDTVLLEASSIGSGQTKNATAKITSQHGLKYAHLEHEYSVGAARQYAALNQEAIEQYEKLIEKHHIDCDFERLPSYLYALQETQRVQDEFEAAKGAGIPCYMTDDTPLPLPVRSALVFPDQAQFHPLKFLFALSGQIKVYENTRVLTVDDTSAGPEGGKRGARGERYRVKTPLGSVYAQHIVFATHYPFVNMPGFFFTKQHQVRSYVVALQGAQNLGGLFFSADKNGLSFRNAGDALLVGGSGHRTGENPQGGRYETLSAQAAALFPKGQITARWSAQDCMPVGALPFIGRYSKAKPHWYVATGFGKWGMTSSMVAARTITGMITGKEEPRSEVFTENRMKIAFADDYAAEGAKAVKSYLREIFNIPDIYTADLKRGQGGVFIYDGVKAGVYKDEEGVLYAIDTKCPHMGCQLEWNADEKSWDCPCHGSRFTYRGELIDGPAQQSVPYKRDEQ